MVQKQIEEDKSRQLVIMNLAVEFDNACTAKDDMQKAYEECNDIPQEQPRHNLCSTMRSSMDLSSKNFWIIARLSGEMSLHSAYCSFKSCFAWYSLLNSLLTVMIAFI
ncbi:hypothetical protein Tco_1091387 [Tanacetum coccineum]|uniref:Uncharacterized protein n=1 Tax=Tanacetum coccineum TaxID=301880 RepID=A0ABQ5I821_9ASTR